MMRSHRRNNTRPPECIRGGAYSRSQSRRRGGSLGLHADADNENRPLRPLSQAPLRPSEGLPQAFPQQVLKPCQADRRAAEVFPCPGSAGAEGFRKKVGALQGETLKAAGGTNFNSGHERETRRSR